MWEQPRALSLLRCGRSEPFLVFSLFPVLPSSKPRGPHSDLSNWHKELGQPVLPSELRVLARGSMGDADRKVRREEPGIETEVRNWGLRPWRRKG